MECWSNGVVSDGRGIGGSPMGHRPQPMPLELSAAVNSDGVME
jgi:hypothetical protein